MRRTRPISGAWATEHLADYIGPLRRFFGRRVTSDEADDLVQDVVTSLLSRKAQNEPENTEAYVFTVARNALYRHQRRTSEARGRRWSAEFDVEALGGDEPSAERSYIDRESLERALAAIEAMPPRTRDIFTLHRFGEMTYAAIARQFGISTSAVEKHIMAALKVLVETMERPR